MAKLIAAAKKFATGEEGATLVEYSLLVALLAAASVTIIIGIGSNVRSLYTSANNAVTNAVAASS